MQLNKWFLTSDVLLQKVKWTKDKNVYEMFELDMQFGAHLFIGFATLLYLCQRSSFTVNDTDMWQVIISFMSLYLEVIKSAGWCCFCLSCGYGIGIMNWWAKLPMAHLIHYMRFLTVYNRYISYKFIRMPFNTFLYGNQIGRKLDAKHSIIPSLVPAPYKFDTANGHR